MLAEHSTNFFNGIHNANELLPWHRWYLLTFENLLRQLDCTITVPYWQWEDDSANPWNQAMWTSPPYWLGGSNNGACVPNGLFVPPFYISPTAGPSQCLTRNFGSGIPSVTDVRSVLQSYLLSWSRLLTISASSFLSKNPSVDDKSAFHHS